MCVCVPALGWMCVCVPQSSNVQKPIAIAFDTLRSARERLEAVQDSYSEVGVKDRALTGVIDEAARAVVAAERMQARPPCVCHRACVRA